jgi:hypothetical protein
MIFVFITFILSAVGVIIFLLWKIPFLNCISEEECGKDFVTIAKEKIDENIKKEVKERLESFLQRFLAQTRRILIAAEQHTTKWLYKIKRKKRTNGEEKND